MRVLLLLGVLAAIIAGGYYWYWTGTPDYAIGEIRSALDSHDVDRFSRYVSVDGVAESVVDGLLAEPVKKAMGRNIVGQWVFAGVLGFVKPDLNRQVRGDILNYVETGSFRSQDKKEKATGMSLSVLDESLGLTSQEFEGIESKKVEDNACSMGLSFRNKLSDKDIVLEVRLKKQEGRWKVVELTNFDSIVTRLIELKGSGARSGMDSAEQHDPDASD